jgi:hypothetical protein
MITGDFLSQGALDLHSHLGPGSRQVKGFIPLNVKGHPVASSSNCRAAPFSAYKLSNYYAISRCSYPFLDKRQTGTYLGAQKGSKNKAVNLLETIRK